MNPTVRSSTRAPLKRPALALPRSLLLAALPGLSQQKPPTTPPTTDARLIEFEALPTPYGTM